MFSPRLGEISRVALENTTGALLACSLFFLVPGMFCRYGCAIAGIFVPCLKSLETITSSSSTSTKATTHSSANGERPVLLSRKRPGVRRSGDGEDNDGEERTRARTRIPTSRSEKLCAQLQYWVAWSLSGQSLAKSTRVPPHGSLARHLELAGIYWLQVFGGAGVVTQKVKNVKDAIVLDTKTYSARRCKTSATTTTTTATAAPRRNANKTTRRTTTGKTPRRRRRRRRRRPVEEKENSRVFRRRRRRRRASLKKKETTLCLHIHT